MDYICAGYTDKGIVKSVNEDNIGLFQAEVDHGQIVLAVVCDGVGGMTKGEVASANVIAWFSDWFTRKLPALLSDFSWDTVRREWEEKITYVNNMLLEYSQKRQIAFGTTLVAALFYNEHILMMNIGDSRFYEVKEQVCQLSKDHSLVQRDVDQGKIRPEDMETDPRRNVLLQCVGASKRLRPEIKLISAKEDCMYFLCSDGFRHKLTESEMLKAFDPKETGSAFRLEEQLIKMTELIKQRKEQDNISVVAVRTGKV